MRSSVRGFFCITALGGLVVAGARAADRQSAPETAPRAEAVVAYRVVDGREIPDSLTGQPGDADAGRGLYFDLERAGCSGCHGSPGGPGAQATVGAVPAPDLAGVGARLSTGQIRLWIVAPRALNADSVMPAYYLAGQRQGAHDPLFGGPRLTAPEVENLVAYLARQTVRE